jgi:general stress protein CsbA
MFSKANISNYITLLLCVITIFTAIVYKGGTEKYFIVLSLLGVTLIFRELSKDRMKIKKDEEMLDSINKENENFKFKK